MAQGPHKTLIGFNDLEQPDDTVRAVSTGEPLPIQTPLGELVQIGNCLNEILLEMRQLNESIESIRE